jgi:LCP family protein required for cell wall assembly
MQLINRPYRLILIILSFIVIFVSVGVVNFAPTFAQDATPTPPPWDGTSRFTVLVMGMDRRPGARDTLRVRTDAILLVSIDPANQSIGVLHIPRDIHLTPPNTGDFVRVNTLMVEGENLQEGYGPYWAMDTIQYNLGIYIDRYVAFDFEAFIAFIDAIGGVTVTTTYTINDDIFPDMDYGFDPFHLPAGTHTLDGENALKFARTRHGDNDFFRGERQMQVVTGVLDRLSSGETFARLLSQAPQLLDQFSHNVYTDLSLDEMIQLATAAITIPRENIHTATMNQDYNLLYLLPNGTNGYIPDRGKLSQLMTETFGDNYFQ